MIFCLNLFKAIELELLNVVANNFIGLQRSDRLDIFPHPL